MTCKEVHQRGLARRSCWHCNPSHGRLKEAPKVIGCFMCGRWFWKGEEILHDPECREFHEKR